MKFNSDRDCPHTLSRFWSTPARIEAEQCRESPPAPDQRGWGVPSWQDVDAYPTAAELDNSEWRWEYLRRRHGFRQDWLRAAAEFAPASRELYFVEVYDVDRPFDPRVAIRDLARGMSTSARRGTATVRYPSSGLAPFRGTLLSQTISDYRYLDRIVPQSRGQTIFSPGSISAGR